MADADSIMQRFKLIHVRTRSFSRNVRTYSPSVPVRKIESLASVFELGEPTIVKIRLKIHSANTELLSKLKIVGVALKRLKPC